MHRAWQPVLIAAFVFAAKPALAFHAGGDFDKLPGTGGGGGLTYTGVPTERGLTCAACHTEAPGKITINLNESSSSLFSSFTYEPGKTYALTATMNGDTTKIDHFNSLVVSVVDDAGKAVGSFSGYSPTELSEALNGSLVPIGKTWNVTTWTFSWTAPATASGRVHLHVAAVAGNAANVPGLSISDPFGDDVFVGTLDLDPAGATAKNDADDSSPITVFACAFFFRRRRSS